MPEPVLPSTARTLLARVARVQRDGRAPSLVAGVVRDGGLAWSVGRGDVSEPHTDVQYRLGSISKTVTAVAVLRLRDEGRVHLDDPLERHVPGTPLGQRTVGQLLSHLGGAAAESPGGWWERTPGGPLEELGLADEHAVLGAARRFHYSNLGFGLLGELVARLRGRAWDDVVRDEVLAPLGMTRTTPRPVAPAAEGHAVHPWADVVLPEPEHHAGVMAAAGQLWSPLADLARFAVFLLGDTGDVLDPATLEEMAIPAGVDSSAPGWSAYGLGLQVMRVEGRTLVGHGGSMPGFLAGVFVDRDEGTGAVSLANATSGPEPVVFGLLADLRAAEPRIVEPWTPAPSPVPLEDLGVWFWGPSPYLLQALHGGLLHLGPLPGRAGRASRFARRDDGTWVGLDGYYAGEPLTIAADHLDLGTFVFTRTPYDPAGPVPGGVDEGGWRH
ncbi:serine hydrolase domain-containing protein [Geodermatophilus sabuli]|uniref:CubicO group peptidase, beta-lactamase class C family n=1 Tax=Geodermatophilus sabuli TaxID=1564158 RepID=A0A285E8F6_9ACTN|nr:serine hydrolase domain-containing protein [Geodermatophilus sabuli]MBB3085230.1 CubicO group peptidase (beta-lactamase class C family) [Geodermatophilus sabuli]SNX95362.1 CubicO group peptidase, beta-lactamase class C family [Geodermatophilus sabuli]